MQKTILLVLALLGLVVISVLYPTQSISIFISILGIVNGIMLCYLFFVVCFVMLLAILLTASKNMKSFSPSQVSVIFSYLSCVFVVISVSILGINGIYIFRDYFISIGYPYMQHIMATLWYGLFSISSYFGFEVISLYFTGNVQGIAKEPIGGWGGLSLKSKRNRASRLIQFFKFGQQDIKKL